MNVESSRSTPITLQQKEELLIGKKAADLLINQYAETSDKQSATEQERERQEGAA